MSQDPVNRLIQELARLPSIGQKTATRLAFHIMRTPDPQARALAQAILDVKDKIRLCSVCMNHTEEDPCAICRSAHREPSRICVVAYPADLLSIERTQSFRGLYHVLHGVLSPLDGVGPGELRIRELLQRVEDLRRDGADVEVILATSPNVEGEATATYLGKLLKPLGVHLTRIASGLPVGGELEYADGITITRALEVRREM